MLSARPYQWELYQQAKQRNVVAYLDTGSGKTLVSVLLMQDFIEPLEEIHPDVVTQLQHRKIRSRDLQTQMLLLHRELTTAAGTTGIAGVAGIAGTAAGTTTTTALATGNNNHTAAAVVQATAANPDRALSTGTLGAVSSSDPSGGGGGGGGVTEMDCSDQVEHTDVIVGADAGKGISTDRCACMSSSPFVAPSHIIALPPSHHHIIPSHHTNTLPTYPTPLKQLPSSSRSPWNCSTTRTS